MTQRNKGRAVVFVVRVLMTAYLVGAHALGMLLPAFALWAAVGLWWTWREGVFEDLSRAAATIAGFGVVVLFWPVGVYVALVSTPLEKQL